MRSMHIFAVAALASVVACTDNPNSVLTGPIDPSEPTTSLHTIAGRISVSGQGTDIVIELRDAENRVYRLVGSESAALASVDGGEVVARGTFDANPGFVVQDFTVTSMRGRPALDGVLVETETGYGLRLRDGTFHVVSGLSPDCAQYVGARLWVIGWEDGTDTAFGLIGAL